MRGNPFLRLFRRHPLITVVVLWLLGAVGLALQAFGFLP